MTLGDLIDTLENMPATAMVRMDFGTIPTHLCSWRGVYAELTLDSEPPAGRYGNRPVEPLTVSQLLLDVQSAVGKSFQGYKGGDFVMDRHTPVWADEWGDYTRRVLTGVVVIDGDVVLTTFVVPAEYS